MLSDISESAMISPVRYKCSEISDRINDTYLKTFGEEEGIRSYGLVTDYLIAWYLKNN